MALPIDVFRNVAKAIPTTAQNAAKATGTTYTPTATAQAQNGLSWTDPITGQKMTVTPAGQGGYMNAYDIYAQRAKTESERQRQELDKDLTTNQNTTNANFDNAQRQAYVDYMRKQKALPSQLQALGVRGGATESGLLNLYNNYGNEHAANEQQRAAELAANQRERDKAWFDYQTQLERDLADRQQTAINNQINEYKNDLATFQQFVAQYPTTEKGYKQYQDWIKKLQAGNDPLKDYKIAAVRAQMASQFPNGLDGLKKKSGGGGGGGGGGGSRRSYGGSSSSYSSSGGSKTSTKSTSNNQGNSVGSYYISSTKTGKVNNKKKSSGLNRTQQNSKYK